MKLIAALLAIVVSADARRRIAAAHLNWNAVPYDVFAIKFTFTQINDDEQITMTSSSRDWQRKHYLLAVLEQRNATNVCGSFGNIDKKDSGAYFYVAAMSPRRHTRWTLEPGMTLVPNATNSILDRAIALYDPETLNFTQPNPPPRSIACGWVRACPMREAGLNMLYSFPSVKKVISAGNRELQGSKNR